jgi:hypothetical protein
MDANVFGANFIDAERHGLTCQQLQAAKNWEFTFRNPQFCHSDNLSEDGVPSVVGDKLVEAARWKDFVARRKGCNAPLPLTDDGF